VLKSAFGFYDMGSLEGYMRLAQSRRLIIALYFLGSIVSEAQSAPTGNAVPPQGAVLPKANATTAVSAVNLSDHDACLQKDNADACNRYANQLSADCKNLYADNLLICASSFQCFQDRAMAINNVNTLCATGDSPACEGAKTRLSKTRQADPGCNSQQLPPFPPYTVEWIPHPPAPYPIPGYAMLLGGHDNDPHQGQYYDLYVCQAPIKLIPTGRYLGIHPGKLLNGLCNVSWGGFGTVTSEYYIAVTRGALGYWAPPPSNGNFSHVLAGGPNEDGHPLYVCHANYTSQEADFTIPVLDIPVHVHDVDHGQHVGKLINGKCDFEWGGYEIASSTGVEVYYMAPRPVPPQQPPTTTHPHPPTNSGIEIQSCQMSPSHIAIGESAALVVTLKQKPSTSVDLAIDIDSNGAQDTLVEQPINLPIAAGSQSARLVIQTRNVLNAATKIIFSPHTGAVRCSTELDIN